jgi:hypothetical protein
MFATSRFWVIASNQAHKGRFTVEAKHISGDADALDAKSKATVLAVLKFYGDKTAQYLSDLTHAERPWRDARHDVAPGENSTNEITDLAGVRRGCGSASAYTKIVRSRTHFPYPAAAMLAWTASSVASDGWPEVIAPS